MKGKKLIGLVCALSVVFSGAGFGYKIINNSLLNVKASDDDLDVTQYKDTIYDEYGNIVSFPGADGGGCYATGGRGGNIVFVTNLNDSGEGSFREAVSKANSIVLFKVGGTIELKSNVVIASNVTVAGQTAPGGAGITVKNYKIGLGGENVILRYVSSRPGELGTSKDYDAFGGANGANSIVDHCSIGWANDEQWGVYSNNDNYTVQYTIIGPANSFSYHSKGVHGFGIMLGKSNASWHHNMIIHNVSRNFRGKVPGTGVIDFVDNVIYDWGYQTAYGTLGHVNYVNNTLKCGNSTKGGYNYLSVGNSGSSPENYQIFLSGNRFLNIDNTQYKNYSDNNWAAIGYDNGKNESNTKTDKYMPITVNGCDVSVARHAQDSESAYNDVASFAGAAINSESKTYIDAQCASDLINGEGTLTGARPYSEANDSQKATIDKYNIACGTVYKYPESTEGYPQDSDGDGMPDEWESARGLNPNSATNSDGSSEANGDYLGLGYTNIEYYINDLTVDSFAKGTVTISPSSSENSTTNITEDEQDNKTIVTPESKTEVTQEDETEITPNSENVVAPESNIENSNESTVEENTVNNINDNSEAFDNVPKTGNNEHIFYWSLGASIALIGIIVYILNRKNKKYNYNN